jgi:hypothetical protein
MEMCNPGLANTQLPGTSGLSFNLDGVVRYITYQPGEEPDPRRLAEMGALVV